MTRPRWFSSSSSRRRAADAARLEELEGRCRELAAILDARESLLPTFGFSIDGGQPHVEAHGDVLAWAVRERGREHQRLETTDPDELLYWCLLSVASSLSSEWAARNREPGVAFRLTMLARRLELLAQLSPAWEARYRAEEASLLHDVGLA